MDSLLSDRRVLVVEDELMVLLTIEDMLAELGCTSMLAAASVEHALKLVKYEDFDVALLDVNLNGTRSYPVADALAEHAVPFLFATGCANPETSNKYADAPLLNKPFRTGALGELLTRMLAA